MRRHDLKTWPSYFDAIASGAKTFEVRINDRDFAEGDIVVLLEWDPTPITTRGWGTRPTGYSRRAIAARIGYVLRGGGLPGGLSENTVVFSLLKVQVLRDTLSEEHLNRAIESWKEWATAP